MLRTVILKLVKVVLSLFRIMKLFSLGLFTAAFSADVVRYDGDRVYHLDNVSMDIIKELQRSHTPLNLDIWMPNSVDEIAPGTKVHVHVKRNYTVQFEAMLNDFESDYRVANNNLQQDVDMEWLALHKNGRSHTLTNYNNLDTIQSWLVSLADANTDVNYVEFGSSFGKQLNTLLKVENRKLMALEIGTGSKVISIDCGIHAREWVSPAYCQWFIDQAINGRFAKYTSDVKFLVQPVLNPDGYEYTWSTERMWRKNRSTGNGVCLGVDLNRNYDADWSGPGASAQPCSESYHGPSVFSEPESQAQRDYVAPYINNGSLKAFLTVHSYGQYILFPFAFETDDAPNKEELNSLGAEMRLAILQTHNKLYTMGQTTDVMYAAAGGSDDWSYLAMYGAGNSAPLSYTFELRDTGNFGFTLPANQITPNAEEMDNGMDVAIQHVIANK